MGVALSGPLTAFDKIYTLPMLTIKEGKGKLYIYIYIYIYIPVFTLSIRTPHIYIPVFTLSIWTPQLLTIYVLTFEPLQFTTRCCV